METVYDWITVGIFAGLIVIFIHRSFDPQGVEDSFWSYLPAAVGCAIGNYLGNEGYVIGAIAVIGAVIGYIMWVIKPGAGLR